MLAQLALALSIAVAPGDGPWQTRLAAVADQRDQLALELGLTRLDLRRRALTENPALLRELEDPPPSARPTGWGLLPELLREEPLSAGRPWENCYDLAELEAWVVRERSGLAELRAAVGGETLATPAAIARYRMARENWGRIDQHVAYHELWQRSAREHDGFFRARNALLADYRLWQAPGGDAELRRRAAAARERIEEDLLGFRPERGPRLERAGDGRHVLRVPLASDIEDEAFRAAFHDSIERNWNDAEAMRARGLRIEIEWQQRAPAELYPAGAPRRGDAIDLGAHRRRFGEAPLVLTTGAASTHAFLGAVFLGTAPVTPRTLAHEFGHLLGFADGYLRAFEGSVDDPRGVLLVEIGPFPEGLMASPATGQVTPGMVRRLLEGYGAPEAKSAR